MRFYVTIRKKTTETIVEKRENKKRNYSAFKTNRTKTMKKYISGQREELIAKKIKDAAYSVPIIKRGIIRFII